MDGYTANRYFNVSAAQHMQVSGSGGGGHVSVAAQQGMYASFQHQGTPSPQHHQGTGCDTYSVSQSQSINFSQAMRARPAGAPQQQAAAAPGQPPLGVAAAGISREQQAKMLQQQQQQMLRAQQQHLRPPPPEYKARFVGASPVPGVGNVGGMGPGVTARRPPAAQPRPFPQHARQYSPEWRHVLMQQQAASRQQFPHHHQGFGMTTMGGGMTQQQQQQMQLQQVRLQQQHLMQHQQQRSSNQQTPMSHLIMQQNQMMSVQGQIPNIHMSQSQSMSMQPGGMGGMASHQGSPMQNTSMQGQTGPIHAQNSSMQNSMMSQNGPMQTQNSNGSQHSFPSLHNPSSFAGQTADFNLDFLDNMPSTDASNLTAQELLNSLDNSFLNDIL
ncbi:histone-lysine N-methyltransferase 2D-like isoform X1 [Manduca sexta]|uniref:histone-lysine N-methyltransferase 2D-like isoform X1 n=1 Tax=Manduca sexta TaxID=7130 RepID=UPI00188FC48E|nr:histone-lysine N-methyltransferase 2D-like isoform X1 [Manduca sexta]